MELTLFLLILVIIFALAFEYINGFHDAANAIATVVSTKTLSPKHAILYGAVLNFFGAFFGTCVAKTIGSGIVDSGTVTQAVILCALLGAIIWNLITWFLGLPSSSSHALIGGLLGAAIMHAGGFSIVNIQGLVQKVVIPMFTSPVMGYFVGFLVMLLLLHIFAKAIPEKINRKFKGAQLFSAGVMAFSHGSNDAQKTMGIITLGLLTYCATHGVVFDGSTFATLFLPDPSKDFHVPPGVIFICALTMGLGTAAGGWKIIHTLGNKVIKLKPIHGFAAETTAAGIILTATHFGIPVSTTQIISSAIMGVGSTIRFSAVKWGLVGNILAAWILTIPISMFIAAGIYWTLSKAFHALGY